jgi:hypothetical protein
VRRLFPDVLSDVIVGRRCRLPIVHKHVHSCGEV